MRYGILAAVVVAVAAAFAWPTSSSRSAVQEAVTLVWEAPPITVTAKVPAELAAMRALAAQAPSETVLLYHAPTITVSAPKEMAEASMW